ncbi:MAG TPA: LLM class flavin-dependent oxidoreductase [Streptosporangiaceae bacterium]|nr:LLM class flavin-dependent oxidoreductase [Streptosporangiaceae bacterium]
MRLGLYYDLRNPGAARRWARVYAAALDRIAWADDEGIGAIWVTEHHGFADGYLPAPLTFCAAIAARTRQARIGTAVVISPLMPVTALAEQAAVVDILSGGRLELGLGAGWRAAEFPAFGADYARRYEALEEAVRSLPELWDSGEVTPAPVQRPLPVWVGARGPRGARLAGRTGAGLLWIDRDLMAPYLKGQAESDPPALPRVGGLVNVFLADDPDRARGLIRENGRRNRASYEDAGGTKSREAAFPKLRILTPAAAAAWVGELCAGLPVTDVFCFGDIGGLPDELVERHTESAVRELAPLLAEEGEL